MIERIILTMMLIISFLMQTTGLNAIVILPSTTIKTASSYIDPALEEYLKVHQLHFIEKPISICQTLSAAETPTPIPQETSTPNHETPSPVPQETSTPNLETPTPIPQETSTPNLETPTPLPQETSTPIPVTPTPIPQDTSTPSPVTPTPLPQETSTPTSETPLVTKLTEYNKQSVEAQEFIANMEDIIDNAVKKSGISTPYGIFIMDLKSEMYYGVNENLTQIDHKDQINEGYFNSASVIKLFQGYIFCDMLRNKELDSEKTFYDKVTGRKFKLLPMIKSMISYSDNNYSNACLRIVDNKKSNEVLNRLGIINSRIYGEMSGAIGYSRENNIKVYGTDKRCARITPQDTALILYNIYKNKDTDLYMKTLNEALLGNIYNTRIPVGVKRVSPKYSVAHKTGTNSTIGVYNDAGIIYTPNPFILVTFTTGTTDSIGHYFIRYLAEKLTIYFKEKQP